MPLPPENPVVIGWREAVDLPEWGIRRLRAKIDTGARTSAIHVENIEYLDANGRVMSPAGEPDAADTVPEGAHRARFDVMLHRRNDNRRATIEAELVRTSTVRPSHGRSQQRPVVETTVRLGTATRRIQLSLVSRRDMLCRMLLGRTALAGVVVDPASKYVITARRRGRGVLGGSPPDGRPGPAPVRTNSTPPGKLS